MLLSSKALERAEKLRDMSRKSAYAVELRTNVPPPSFASPKDVAEMINSYSKVRGKDALAAAAEVNTAKDPLDAISKLMPDVDDAVLNYMMAQCSYKYFSMKYFPHLFTRPMCPKYHDVYFDICRDVETHRITLPAIVAGPPEWGKTTIGCVILPLHCIVFDNVVYMQSGMEKDLTKRFIGIITVVEKNARRTLETIKAELESNEAIRRDFGEFYKVPGSKTRNEPWSESVAVTLNEKRLEIFGRKGKVRGAMWKGNRLDLPIGDDLEDDENSRSLIKQDRDYEWLQMIVNRTSKEKGNVMILGNLVNPNGLLDRCVKDGTKKGWRVEVFRLYEKDPETGQKIYTWPEEFGEDYEHQKRLVTGDQNFEAEFLSNPEAYNREVEAKDFIEYDFNEDFRERLDSMVVYSAADPAATISNRSDFMAIVTIAEDRETGLIHVLPPINQRVPTSVQADLILDVQSQWGASSFGVEAIAYQSALVDRISERRRERGNMFINCVPIHHPYMTKKRERIAQRTYKRIQDGVIRVPSNCPTARIMVDQLINLKTSMYDDLADSLEMALRLRDKDLGIKSGIRTSFATIKQDKPRQAPVEKERAPYVSKFNPPDEEVVPFKTFRQIHDALP